MRFSGIYHFSVSSVPSVVKSSLVASAKLSCPRDFFDGVGFFDGGDVADFLFKPLLLNEVVL